jgi:hypothetical protein
VCNCARLHDCERPHPTRAEFLAPFDLVSSPEHAYDELFRCRVCGQHWMVGRPDGSHGGNLNPDAFKIADVDGWRSFDRRAAADARFIRDSGGLSEARCLRKGCEERAVRGFVFCVRDLCVSY